MGSGPPQRRGRTDHQPNRAGREGREL